MKSADETLCSAGDAPPLAIHHGRFWRSMYAVRDRVAWWQQVTPCMYRDQFHVSILFLPVWNPFRFIQMVNGAQGCEETAGT